MSYSTSDQLAWVWLVTKGYHIKIGLYILMETVSVALVLCFVYWSKQAVDIATGITSGALAKTLIFITGSIVLAIMADLMASWMVESVKVRLTIRLQDSLIYSQMMSAWTMTKRWHTGDLLVRMNADCPEVVQMLAYTFPSFCVTCVKLLASLGFLWVMDPMLAGMMLAITPLFLFAKVYYKRMRRLSKSVKQAESHLGAVMQENLKHRLLIRALQSTTGRWGKLLDCQDLVLRLKVNQLKFSVFTQGILKLTFNAGYLLAFFWGVYRLQLGQISYGTMTAFLQLVGRIQMPAIAMVAFLPAAIRCRTATDRLMELGEGEKEAEGEAITPGTPLSLRLNNLSFCYEGRKIIGHMSAVFQSGAPAAIVGATGKGKTTLIRLMLALIKPDKGTLSLESGGKSYGVSVHTRGNFAYVPQGNTLFTGTVRENLLLAGPGVSEGRLREVLDIACAGFVYSLPQGIDTLVGESGHGLSEGQAQRIAIARALLRGGSIWLFDEATSALDVHTANQLISNLLQAGQDKILIFVTHDPHLMEACSQVIRLD